MNSLFLAGISSILFIMSTRERSWGSVIAVSYTHLDYNPRPIDLEDVELSTDFIELREAIAENAHEVWADQRQEEGWTY